MPNLTITWNKNRAQVPEMIEGIIYDFTEVYDDTIKEIKPTATAFLERSAWFWAEEHFKNVSWVEDLEEFADGEKIPEGDMYTWFETNLTFNNYGKSLTIDKNAIADEKYGYYRDWMRKLAKAWVRTQDKHAYQVLNSAFNINTVYNGATIFRMEDGRPLCSSFHPVAAWWVSSNTFDATTTQLPLSPEALRLAKVNLMLQKTDTGEPIDMWETIQLIVAPANYQYALEIVNAIWLADTNFNNANGNAWIEVFTNARLATQNGWSDTAWFLRVVWETELKQRIRQELELDSTYDFDTKSLKFSIDWRWTQWYTNWRWFFGSKWDWSPYAW